MRYIAVKWRHSLSNEPIMMLSELDENRLEIRKVEIFPSGELGFASTTESRGATSLGTIPVPPLSEINADPQFEATEIAAEQFESMWSLRTSSVL